LAPLPFEGLIVSKYEKLGKKVDCGPVDDLMDRGHQLCRPKAEIHVAPAGRNPSVFVKIPQI